MRWRWSLHEEFVGDALQNDIEPRVGLTVWSFDDAIASRERVVWDEFDRAVRVARLCRDQRGVGGVQADLQMICSDGPFEGGANQIENGFGLNVERATQQPFGDSDSDADSFLLALVEPMVTLSVQLIGSGLQCGE